MSRTTITVHSCCRGTWEGFVACERHAEQHRLDLDAPPLPCLLTGLEPCEFARAYGLEPPYPPLVPPEPELVFEPFDLEALLDHLEEQGGLP